MQTQRRRSHCTSAKCMTSILRHVAEAFPPPRQGTILNSHRVIGIATNTSMVLNCAIVTYVRMTADAGLPDAVLRDTQDLCSVVWWWLQIEEWPFARVTCDCCKELTPKLYIYHNYFTSQISPRNSKASGWRRMHVLARSSGIVHSWEVKRVRQLLQTWLTKQRDMSRLKHICYSDIPQLAKTTSPRDEGKSRVSPSGLRLLSW